MEASMHVPCICVYRGISAHGRSLEFGCNQTLSLHTCMHIHVLVEASSLSIHARACVCLCMDMYIEKFALRAYLGVLY